MHGQNHIKFKLGTFFILSMVSVWKWCTCYVSTAMMQRKSVSSVW